VRGMPMPKPGAVAGGEDPGRGPAPARRALVAGGVNRR
jgi:hypothetical protein